MAVFPVVHGNVNGGGDGSIGRYRLDDWNVGVKSMINGDSMGQQCCCGVMEWTVLCTIAWERNDVKQLKLGVLLCGQLKDT
jgi:hypothetical protein